MPLFSPPPPAPGLTSFFRSAGAMRSRSLGALLLSGQLNTTAPPARLVADWARDMAAMDLQPGDVEPLPLARTRARWPGYRPAVDALADWTRAQGLGAVLADADEALMACRGARYHHDGAQYGGAAFCNLFLDDDKGLDVHFAATGQRIPLRRGTVLVFDTGQPHAVIPRHRSGFDAADFADGLDRSLVFLTWELPVEDAAVAAALGVVFDTDAHAARRLNEEQVWVNGAPAEVCPQTGRWLLTP